MSYAAQRDGFRRRIRGGAVSWVGVAVAVLGLLAGCAQGPRMYGGDAARTIDRKYVEYPAGYELTLVADRLTAPSAMTFLPDGSIVLAETGAGPIEPRIYGWRPDGTYFDVYPKPDSSPFAFLKKRFHIYAPIGGMVYHDGGLFVSHRDENRMGVITRFGIDDGSTRTVVADLPAQGDNSVTDITLSPTGRLIFGVGTATNSGVVGLDNFKVGWVQEHPLLADQSYVPLKLYGYRFNTPNPRAGLFVGEDVAVTAPFQPFGVSNQTRIAPSPVAKPNGAIYSISPTGGDLRVEAHGIRLPRGLRYNEFGRLYATNNGMELRGTRPVQDDPDALLRIVPGTWYGWPDYTADVRPVGELEISDATKAMIVKSGYPDLAFLIDHGASGLLAPNRDTLVSAAFPSLSGAAKFDFVPEETPFREFRGNAIVGMSGDRAPFASGGQPLRGTVGFEVVRVDMDTRQVKQFIFNTKGKPKSRIDKTEAGDAMERPIDIKIAPDGSMYILDFGQMRLRGGNPEITRRSGRLYRLTPLPTTQPAAMPTQPVTSWVE
jgi:glucose/arabinose dehydrogenase